MGLNHDHASAFGGRNCYWWLKLCGQSRYNFIFFPTRSSSEIHQKFIRSSLRNCAADAGHDRYFIRNIKIKQELDPISWIDPVRSQALPPRTKPPFQHKKKRRRFRNTTWGRWIKTVLAWQPRGHKRIGRPKCCWDSMTTNFWRLINFPIVQLILVYGV